MYFIKTCYCLHLPTVFELLLSLPLKGVVNNNNRFSELFWKFIAINFSFSFFNPVLFLSFFLFLFVRPFSLSRKAKFRKFLFLMLLARLSEFLIAAIFSSNAFPNNFKAVILVFCNLTPFQSFQKGEKNRQKYQIIFIIFWLAVLFTIFKDINFHNFDGVESSPTTCHSKFMKIDSVKFRKKPSLFCKECHIERIKIIFSTNVCFASFSVEHQDLV